MLRIDRGLGLVTLLPAGVASSSLLRIDRGLGLVTLLPRQVMDWQRVGASGG